MNEDKQLRAMSKVLDLYNEIEQELLILIAQHFKINDEFISSDYWRIQKLQEMGVFNEDVIKFIARYTRTTPETIKSALNKLGIDTYNLNTLNRAFEDEMISINPNTLLENGVIQAIINTQYNEMTNSLINLSPKIIEGTRRAYLNIVEETYLKTSTGTHSYQEAIRESIDKLSKNGIKTLDYITRDETGEVVGYRSYSIEGAVRREVLTNTRNLSNNINKEIIDELKPKYVKFSEHLECRPQHFSWQGTIVETTKWESISHYGEVDGLGGINCKHYVEPYFGDKRGKEEKKYSAKECEEAYKLQQKQRYLERGIRTWANKKNLFKEIGDKEMYSKANRKFKEWWNRYDYFAETNDLKKDYTRTYTK